jgi:mono/diheme cytochrome c family protein
MRKIVLGALVVTAVACGDPATEDARGYTKAPLEKPGLVVGGEPESAMDVAVTLEPGLTGTDPSVFEEAAAEPSDAGEAGEAGEAGGETEPEGAGVALAAGVTQEQFDEGDRLFSGAGGCMACHGPEAGGSTLGPDLTDDQWLHVDAPEVDALAGVIRDGVAEPVQYPAPMPPMGGASLSDDQVRALAAYIASITEG